MNLHLPNEIWDIILSFLDDKDLINILYLSNEYKNKNKYKKNEFMLDCYNKINSLGIKINSSLIIKHIDKKSVNFWNKIYQHHFLKFLNKEMNFINGCLETYSIVKILENDLGVHNNNINNDINVYNNMNNVLEHINNIYKSVEIKLDYKIENIFKSINNFNNKKAIKIILQNFKSPTSMCV